MSDPMLWESQASQGGTQVETEVEENANQEGPLRPEHHDPKEPAQQITNDAIQAEQHAMQQHKEGEQSLTEAIGEPEAVSLLKKMT